MISWRPRVNRYGKRRFEICFLKWALYLNLTEFGYVDPAWEVGLVRGYVRGYHHGVMEGYFADSSKPEGTVRMVEHHD